MNELELPEFNPFETQDVLRAILQLFVIGFPTHELPDNVAEELEKGLGGVILFRRNIVEMEQVLALNEQVHALADAQPLPPFVSLDQEGGRVVRVREPLVKIPPMRAVGNKHDLHLAADIADVIASEVGALGFNLNYSPVLDVDTNPNNPVIGDRAFSRDPEWVARFGGAFVAGHIAAGVIPCGKHFPGHGDTDTDSHLALPTIHHARERLDAVELLPFKKLSDFGIPMIMTAHVNVPAIDADEPATLSKKALTDILRGELEFKGVIVSDDLEMAAVADLYEIETLVEKSLLAGADLFLICHDFEKFQRAVEHLLLQCQENSVVKTRVFESANRIAKLKKSYLRSWPKPWKRMGLLLDTIGSDSHREVIAKIRTLKDHAHSHSHSHKHHEHADDFDPTERS